MTRMNSTLSSPRYRQCFAAFGALALACGLSACLPEKAQYEGLAPMKRNEVSVVHLTHDIKLDPETGKLPAEEEAKLRAFAAAHGLGYGDQLGIDAANKDMSAAGRKLVAPIMAQYGLSVGVEAQPIGLAPAANTVRLVVTRHLVRKPPCPNWSEDYAPNWNNTQSSNFGCATVSNLGAMIADPSDLVNGKTYAGQSAARAAKAVDVYQRAIPSGSKQASGGGSSGDSGGGSSGDSGGGDK